MNSIPVHKATAGLIVAIAEMHVEKAMSDGDVNRALLFQSAVTAINMALESNLPIKFD